MRKIDLRKMAVFTPRGSQDLPEPLNVETLVRTYGKGFRVIIMNEVGGEMYDGSWDGIHGPLILRKVLGYGYFIKKFFKEPQCISRKTAVEKLEEVRKPKHDTEYNSKIILCIVIK